MHQMGDGLCWMQSCITPQGCLQEDHCLQVLSGLEDHRLLGTVGAGGPLSSGAVGAGG